VPRGELEVRLLSLLRAILDLDGEGANVFAVLFNRF
jgi:hypothetical protein